MEITNYYIHDMKRLLTILGVLLLGCLAARALPSRTILPFDKDWRFVQSDPAGAQAPAFDDRSWRRLDLPHDWSIEGENREDNPGGGSIGYFPTGTGWYRKTFDIPGYGKDRLYSIEFDGIYMNSTVWINGHELGTWPYGYSSFSYDLTPYLKARGNVIAVRIIPSSLIPAGTADPASTGTSAWSPRRGRISTNGAYSTIRRTSGTGPRRSGSGPTSPTRKAVPAT